MAMGVPQPRAQLTCVTTTLLQGTVSPVTESQSPALWPLHLPPFGEGLGSPSLTLWLLPQPLVLWDPSP